MLIFLRAGRLLGRFAILLLAAVLLCPLLIWLVFLDWHPVFLVVGAIVAIPAAMLAVVLTIGTVFAGLRPSKLQGMNREAAPELWALWEAVVGKDRARRTTIVLDDTLNAGIAEERVLFGLLGRRVFLFVGIPLLAVTDERALAAIFAHEDAHVRNRDTNGSLNLVELEKSFDLIFDYAHPGESLSGGLLYVALGPLSRSFHKEEVRLSRLAELEADRHAAAKGSAQEATRALILVEAAASLFDETVYEPLQRELLGAMTAPRPPLDRLLAAAESLKESSILHAHTRKAWNRPDDPEADHPALAARLAALGYDAVPEVEPVSTSAFLALLGGDIASERVSYFNDQWVSSVENYLER